MRWSLPLTLQAVAIARTALDRDGAQQALDEAADVAKETGAMISLEAVETTRTTLGALR
jgi:hypothetical protein